MPLNGSGTYSAPPGTTATPNTTILSAAYNALVADLTTVLNTARPIAYGGTGGTSQITGWDGISAAGIDVASAGTINLTTATGPFIDITGTTTVTAVTLAAGTRRIARAAAAFRLTASASLIVNNSTTVSYTTSAGDLLFFEGYGSSVVRVWVISTPLYGLTSYPPGTLYGLTLSNNSGTPLTKIDIAAGAARDGADSANMDLAAAITAKDATAVWAVGSSAGCLDTGALANSTWYHGWLIKRPDTGVVDFLLSTSATSPTMPTNYTLKRRIGSPFKTNGSAQFAAFVQLGDRFLWSTPTTDLDTSSTGTSAVLQAMNVPTGITMRWIGIGALVDNTSGNACAVLVTSPSQADTAPVLAALGQLQMPNAATNKISASQFEIDTDTSARVRYRASASSANIFLRLSTQGWVDNRGRI